MADNVAVTPGSGATIATDDVGGVQYQRVKITWGADGTANDASAANPLPVDGSAVTQPVSAAALPLPSGAATSAKQDSIIAALGSPLQAGGSVGVSGSVAVTGSFFQATQPVSAASLPLPSGASTAAKQPALGTAGSASSDVLSVQGVASMTALKTDGSAVTQPVSAASLPLPSGAATSAKQDSIITALGSVAVTGTFWQATQPVSGTFWQTTQPVSAASLPLPSGAATSAKQDSIISALASVPVTGTFWQATQPVSGTVTANAGTNLNTSALALESGGNLAGIVTRLGEVQSSPTANTVLDRLKALLTGIVLSAGSAIIGKVGIDQTTPGTTNGVQVNAALPTGTNELGKTNWRHINVTGATLTRPANTTAYSANDSISNSATAGSVTALTTNNLSDVNDDPVTIAEIMVDTTDTGPGTSSAVIRCHLFNADPTASTGVGAGDNVAWSNKRAGWIGSFSGTMRLFSDGSRGVLVPDEGTARITAPVTGAKNLYYQLQTLVAFTPSANSTTFIPTFKGIQGRG